MSDKTYINCKKTLEFSNKYGETLTIPRDYVGSVPFWVTDTWLFKAACKDSTITFVGRSNNQAVVSDNDSSDAELLALRERAKELGIKTTLTMKAETLKSKIAVAEALKNTDDESLNEPPKE